MEPLSPRTPIIGGLGRFSTFQAQWVSRYDGNCLNDVPPFDVINPTAEEVARALADEITESVPEATVEYIEVGEAAGFSAIYWPEAE
jgi:6-pyruvoyltetrahydropterin/6-carboxytetrahydropterin synthase